MTKLYHSNGSMAAQTVRDLESVREAVEEQVEEWIAQGVSLSEIEAALFNDLGYTLSSIRVRHFLRSRKDG